MHGSGEGCRGPLTVQLFRVPDEPFGAVFYAYPVCACTRSCRVAGQDTTVEVEAQAGGSGGMVAGLALRVLSMEISRVVLTCPSTASRTSTKDIIRPTQPLLLLLLAPLRPFT